MRNSYVIVLALGSLLSKIGSKSRVPLAYILCCIEKSVAKVTGTTLLHMRICACKRQFAGFICRWRKAGLGKDLIRRIKVGEVTDFSQNHGSHTETNTRDRGNRRLDRIHHFFNCSLMPIIL